MTKHATLILEVDLQRNQQQRLEILKQLISNSSPQHIETLIYPESYRNLVVDALERQEIVFSNTFGRISHIASFEDFWTNFNIYKSMPEY